jgi:hypothetical protein
LLVLLLALLDMLLIRTQERAARKLFREQFSKREASESSDTPPEK